MFMGVAGLRYRHGCADLAEGACDQLPNTCSHLRAGQTATLWSLCWTDCHLVELVLVQHEQLNPLPKSMWPRDV